MNIETLFTLSSTGFGEWETPDNLFAQLDDEFHFTLDAAASHENTKCETYCTPYGSYEYGGWVSWEDGLTADWYDLASSTHLTPRVWLNPPYGRGVGEWIAKCLEEAEKGCLVVALLPARTDTKWFHDYIYNKPRHDVEVRFLRGRLKFKGAANSAPFPSMIVIFRP